MNFAREPGLARLRSQPFFLECDRRGRVLWLSTSARERLGATDNLFDRLPAEAVSPVLRLLSGEDPGLEVHTDEFRLSDGRRVPLSIWRLFAQDDRVWLAAQITEDGPEAALAEIREWRNIQESVLKHYFQLQNVQERLHKRKRRKETAGRSAIRLLEQERARLGRDLHAGVGQALAGVRVHLELVNTHMPEPPEAVRASLERIGILAQEALEQVRSVARRLHPPEWEKLAVEEALRQLWDVMGIPQRFEAELVIEPLPATPQHAQKVLIYRAAQEALSNLVRHSGATQVRMRLEFRENQFVLSVRDNGTGFDAAALAAQPAGVGSGVGLRSIREQAAGLGGTFVVQSNTHGTTLLLSLPVQNDTEDQ